jgi:hypothetical protein
MWKSERSTVVVAMLVGALSGAAVSLLVSGRNAPSEARAEGDRPGAPRHEIRERADDVAALERRLRSLEASSHERPVEPRAAAHEPERHAPASPEEEAASQKKLWSEALSRHAEEPVAAHWALTTSTQLRSRLADKLSANAAVKALDCRSSTCRGTIELGGSDGDMNRDAMTVVHADYELPCAVNIHVPNHERTDVRVEAEVLFDCGPEA